MAIALAILLGLSALPANGAQVTSGYYGSQLTVPYAIDFYDGLVLQVLDGNIDIHVTFEQPAPDSRTQVDKELIKASTAFYYDYPGRYWIKNSAKATYEGSTGISGIKAVYVKRPSKTGDTEKIEQEIARILDLATQHSDPYDQLKVVHDELAAMVIYDARNSPRMFEITGALVDKRAVCEGYALAFKTITDLLGYPNVLVGGLADSYDKDGNPMQEKHMWNYVFLEDQWYAVDVTWDDQAEVYYDYFLVGSQTPAEHFGNQIFSESHIEVPFAEGLVYPELSKDAYR